MGDLSRVFRTKRCFDEEVEMTVLSGFLRVKAPVLGLIMWADGFVLWRALYCLVKKGSFVPCVKS